jgi:acetate---CoA ligase (ADP-forming)
VPQQRGVFSPRSVALVGASGRERSLPARTLTNLTRGGFGGPIYPVNPNYEELAGLPCFPSLADVPGPVDLALVLVAAAQAPAVIDDCVAANVGTAVVFAGGFAETGADGQAAQDAMATAARDGGVRLLGPNCQGIIHQPTNLVATFSASVHAGLDTSSGVAYLGQSGALGGSFLGLARERGIGLTAWCSVGNQSGVTITELAGELLDDPEIRVVAMNFETIPDGGSWQALLHHAAQRDVRIVVLRSGRTEEGRRAARSHTGAMVSADAAFELTNERAGAIAVHDADELLDTVEQLLTGRRPAGPRIAVLTSSGGAGALAADQIAMNDLDLAQLSDATRAALAQVVPDFGSTVNPVDTTAQLFVGEPDAFERALTAVVDDSAVDSVIVVLTNVLGPAGATVAQAIANVTPATDKPIAVTWLAARDETAQGRAILAEAGVVVHGSVGAPIRNAARLVVRPQPQAPPPVRQSPNDPLPLDGPQLLDRLGIARPQERLADTPAAATGAARELGDPDVVLKLHSPGLVHKTEAGAVRVGVAPADVEAAATEMLAAAAAHDLTVNAIVVQRRAAPGLELLIGVEGAQNGYPPVMTAGLGGTATELLRDVASALAPLTRDDALALLQRLRSWPLLAGHRGAAGVDLEAVVDAVVAVSQAATQLGERLAELEINPLIAHEQGATAVDLVLRLV